MAVLQSAVASAQDGRVFIDDDANVLHRIRTAECALAVWRRRVPSALAGTLSGLSPDDVEDIDTALPIGNTAIHAAARLAAAGYPHEVATALALDIADLGVRHAALWRWPAVRVRLDWIETDACRRFHADMLGTRLLTTYIGRGTQWRLAEEADTEVREMRNGEVAIFKGRLLAPEAPLLHRSPPIAADGGRRLLLVIDEPRTADMPKG